MFALHLTDYSITLIRSAFLLGGARVTKVDKRPMSGSQKRT